MDNQPQPQHDNQQGPAPQPHDEQPFSQPQQPQFGAQPPVAPVTPPPTFQPPASDQPAMPQLQPAQWQQPPQHTQPDAPVFAPPTSMPGGSKGANKGIILGLIIAGAVLVIGIAVYFLFFRGGNNIISTLTGTSDVVTRSDGTLDLSNLIDSQSTIKEQSIKGKLNQQINLSNGMSYMVTGVKRNVTTTSRLVKAGAGKELIEISIVVGNRDKNSPMYFLPSDFKIRNSAGGMQSPKFVTSDDVTGVLDSQEIASAKQVKGTIIYEVDKDEKISAVLTEDTYQHFGDTSGSDKDIVLKSEVSLQ